MAWAFYPPFKIKFTFDLDSTKKQDGLFIFKEATHYNRLKLEYKDKVISFIFDIKGNNDEAFDQIISFIKLLISHNEEPREN